jgi:hypothetical protein
MGGFELQPWLRRNRIPRPIQVEFNQGEIVELEPASTWVDLTVNLGCAAIVSLGQSRSNLTKVRL